MVEMMEPTRRRRARGLEDATRRRRARGLEDATRQPRLRAATAAGRGAATLGRRLARMAVMRVVLAVIVARERRALAALSERNLRDIGVDRAAAAREAARGFWDFSGGDR